MLSIWVATMSTIPCCGDDSCEDIEISKEQASHHEDSRADCPPLVACGTCGGFVFQATSFSFQQEGIENENNMTPFAIGTLVSWPLEIWQPPKLV